MLCLYLDTLLIGYNFCSMLSILIKSTLQKELQNFMTSVLDKKVKTQQQQRKFCQSRELNPCPLAPHSDV